MPLSVYAEVHSRHCCITPPPAFDPLDIFESEERFGGIFRAVEDDGTTKPHTEVKSKTHTQIKGTFFLKIEVDLTHSFLMVFTSSSPRLDIQFLFFYSFTLVSFSNHFLFLFF
jgi:hypothetical protein